MYPVPLVVSPGLMVLDLMEIYMEPRKLLAVPVMAGERVMGLITYARIQQVPREEWGRVVVSQIMAPRDHLHIISPQQPLHEALALMEQCKINQALVMEGERLVGMVSREAIVRLLGIREQPGLAVAEEQHTNHLRNAS